MTFSQEELIHWNQRGVFPGPFESEESFLSRIAAIEKHAPPQNEISASDFQGAYHIVHSHYDCAPDWVHGFYSDANLPPWQGAAAWFTDDAIPLIQLKTGFRKGSYLKFYQRDEVLAHELAHCARVNFHEPKFEEILAYRTAKNPLRRWFGPLFRHSWESYLFAILLLCPMIGNFLMMFWESSLILKLFANLPWIMLCLLFARLASIQWIFSRAIKKIQSHLSNPKMAYAVAFRLTDQEICDFALSSPDKLKRMIKNQSSLRWVVLRARYF